MEKKTVMLTITEQCNLDCSYCYEKNKSSRAMSIETAQSIIEYELSKQDGFDTCEIQFFGGEPFLRFDFIQEICGYIWRKNGIKDVYVSRQRTGHWYIGKYKTGWPRIENALSVL